ncbi:MAG: hypothetical protein QXQ53_04490 [Candidatus Methanosuratincola sp.]
MLDFILILVAGVITGFVLAELFGTSVRIKALRKDVDMLVENVDSFSGEVLKMTTAQKEIKEGILEITVTNPATIGAFADAALHKRKISTALSDGRIVTFVPTVLELKVRIPLKHHGPNGGVRS